MYDVNHINCPQCNCFSKEFEEMVGTPKGSNSSSLSQGAPNSGKARV